MSGFCCNWTSKRAILYTFVLKKLNGTGLQIYATAADNKPITMPTATCEATRELEDFAGAGASASASEAGAGGELAGVSASGASAGASEAGSSAAGASDESGVSATTGALAGLEVGAFLGVAAGEVDGVVALASSIPGAIMGELT